MRQTDRCALILAGGSSRRMGQDKALLPWGKETLLERAVRFWLQSGRVDRVLVAEGTPGRLFPLPMGAEPVADRVPGRGPMEGLVAGFQYSGAELLYVSAVDLPNLRPEAILPPPEHDVSVYRRADRAEPLFGVYRASVVPAAQGLLDRGNGRMSDLLKAVRTDYYYTPPCLEGVLQNLNTPADCLAARAGSPPMVTVTGWSGSGKTTFLRGLIPALGRRGLRVAVIKHDAHGFEMDRQGKDTWLLSRAGAQHVAILGPGQWALLGRGERQLDQLRQCLPPVDLILGEGFKYSPLPKLEICRAGTGQERITRDDSLLALITDHPLEEPVPQLGLEDYEGCARLLCRSFGLGTEYTERKSI